MLKKIFETEIEGVKIGFRFNMLTLGKACDFEKCNIDEFYKRIGFGEVEENKNVSPNITTILNFFYAAAICYAEGEKKEIDFDQNDVADWLGFIGLDKAMAMMAVQFKSPDLKNSEALETPGQ